MRKAIALFGVAGVAVTDTSQAVVTRYSYLCPVAHQRRNIHLLNSKCRWCSSHPCCCVRAQAGGKALPHSHKVLLKSHLNLDTAPPLSLVSVARFKQPSFHHLDATTIIAPVTSAGQDAGARGWFVENLAVERCGRNAPDRAMSQAQAST